MKTVFYTTIWNGIKMNFDYRGAFKNWSHYADEISVAVGPSEDNTLDAIRAEEKNFPLKIITTNFSPSDPFFYGKTLNAALQNATADIYIEQDMDDRWGGDKQILLNLGEFLKMGYSSGQFYSFFYSHH